MKLLMDIGNRRLKWATTSGGGLEGSGGALDYHDAPANHDDNHAADKNALPALVALDAQFSSLQRPQSVWVSCVAGAKIRRAVDEYARRAWSLQAVFVAAQKQYAGIINRYAEPTSLGSDRWAALLAARDLHPRQSVIVVDVGTAVTVDLLKNDGVFCGGVIIPGVHAMSATLANQTANLAAHMADDNANNMPDSMCPNMRMKQSADYTDSAIATDTRRAVAGGALLAVAGGINLAMARQSAFVNSSADKPTQQDTHAAHCKIIITGGDAKQIAPLLDLKPHIDPQLVLRGLAIIAHESGG